MPYCQSAPNNTELAGLYQCQFAGVDQTTFVGGAAVGLVADAGVPTAGGAPELNSAQRGHLRFVSVRAFVRSFVRSSVSVR